MRRIGVASIAVAMVLVTFAPGAAAKKPVVEDPPTYTAKISFVSDNGIATTCLDDEGNQIVLQVTRTDERRGAIHFEAEGARLDIVGDLFWDGPVVGCRGSHVAPEYFRITLNDDGTVAMLWIFDVEEIEQIVILRNGKTTVETSRADFRMGGPYDSDGNFAETAVTEDDSGTLTLTTQGTYAFVRYDSQADEMMVPLRNSPQNYTLEIALIPD